MTRLEECGERLVDLSDRAPMFVELCAAPGQSDAARRVALRVFG